MKCVRKLKEDEKNPILSVKTDSLHSLTLRKQNIMASLMSVQNNGAQQEILQLTL